MFRLGVLDEAGEVLDGAASLEEVREGLPASGLDQHGSEGLEEMEGLGAQVVQRPRHLEQHHRGHRHASPDDLATDLLGGRRLAVRRLEVRRVLDRERMPDPIGDRSSLAHDVSLDPGRRSTISMGTPPSRFAIAAAVSMSIARSGSRPQ